MAQALTYKQVLNIFELIAAKHLQINDYIVGRNFEVPENIKFPFLQVSPYTAQVIKNIQSPQFNTLEITLKLRILEQLNKEEVNKTDAYSDTLSIMTDVFTIVNKHPQFISKMAIIVNDVEMIAEEELTTLNAVGWAAIVRIRIQNYTGACSVPLATIDSSMFYSDYDNINHTKP